MNFQNIIAKYEYDKDLAIFLKEVYQELINEFGQDKEYIIYEALLNTPIIVANNILDASRNIGIPVNLELPSDFVAGIEIAEPDIVYDESENIYHLKDIKRAIITKGISDDNKKGSLIHELGHLVKSYLGTYTINGDFLTFRSGLMYVTYKLTHKNGTVSMELISSKGRGIEEGLNSLLEEKIARKIVNPNYKIEGCYEIVNAFCGNFYQLIPPHNILSSQILNAKETLIRIFNQELRENSYEEFERILDVVYDLSLKLSSNFSNSSEIEAVAAELKRVRDEEYLPLLMSIIEEKKLKKVS